MATVKVMVNNYKKAEFGEYFAERGLRMDRMNMLESFGVHYSVKDGDVQVDSIYGLQENVETRARYLAEWLEENHGVTLVPLDDQGQQMDKPHITHNNNPWPDVSYATGWYRVIEMVAGNGKQG